MTVAEQAVHEPASRNRLRWALAALIAAAVHSGAGAVAFLYAPPQERVSEDLGAPMVVEFAEFSVAPETEEVEPSPSTDAEAAAASPEIAEKLSAQPDPDLPTAEASPYEAPPDLQVAQEKTREQTEAGETTQTTEAMDRREEAAPSAAAQATAASSPVVASIDDQMAAPDDGSVLDAAQAPQSWQRSLIAHLGRHKRYPQAARSRRMEGVALVRATITRAGALVTASISRSSGSPLLDAEALATLERAAPFPALPARVRGERVEVAVPFHYRLK